MKKKCNRIAIFLPSLRGGGAERVMVTLANEFARREIKIDLLLGVAEGPYLSELSQSVNVIDLNVNRIAYAVFGLTIYLRKVKPDVLLSTMRHANIIAIMANKLSLTGTRVVVREANTLSVSLGRDPSFIDRLLPRLMKVFYPMARHVVAVSIGVREELIKIAEVPESKISVIYSPVVTQELYEKSEEKLQHAWFNESTCPVIITAGRLTKQKDFKSLIEAFCIVREKINVRLIILGEGSLRGELEKFASDCKFSDDISLPGFIQNPFPYMKAADLYVLSSLWEGLPNGLIQSLALGTSVVSTDCPSGPAEILESGKWGVLTPVADPEAMASAIILALEQKNNNQTSEAIQYCKTIFGSESIADKYFSLLLGE